MECIYEPPQENLPEGFEVSGDPRADTVEALAELLGLKKVYESVCRGGDRGYACLIALGFFPTDG